MSPKVYKRARFATLVSFSQADGVSYSARLDCLLVETPRIPRRIGGFILPRLLMTSVMSLGNDYCVFRRSKLQVEMIVDSDVLHSTVEGEVCSIKSHYQGAWKT